MGSPLEQLEGKYELLEKIREGGMGSVYKVRHRLLDEVRVIKVMRPQLAEDETLKARFLREAKVAIRLRHQNLAQIYDFTMDDNDYAYLVMEFIDGLNLQEIIKILGRPSPGLALEIAHQSLAAIAYLHRKRIIHRDISPDNILVARDEDGAPEIKLIDLGIAKERDGEDSLTSAGTFLGKVRYSAPEQFRTQEGTKIGARSDLYSFGIVLYELLTGRYPIKGSNIASLISGHLMQPPLEFDMSDPDGAISEPLRDIVLKAMAKEPDDRFDSATSFQKALAPHREEWPVEEDQLRSIFEIPTLTTRSIRTIKPGSTQSRIDRSFGISTTPPPGDGSDGDADIESSGTVETGSDGRGRISGSDEATQNQIRALLLGAGKLVESRHYDEARLQLATVLELSPDNTEARKLLKVVEAADVKLQQRRQRTADEVRRLVLAGEFGDATKILGKASETDGPAEIFEQLGTEIEEGRERHSARLRQLTEMKTRAEVLVGDENFDEAISVLQEAIGMDPDDQDLRSRLDDAQGALAKRLETQRKEREQADTAAKIADYIVDGDPDEAERALAVAVKLYGETAVLSNLQTDIDELRKAQRLATAEELHIRARELMKATDFASAIERLEEAHMVAPEAGATKDLLAAAREGLRLQQEAHRRQKVIDEASLRIDRLILAGRLESAVRLVDTAVGELGDFDEAKALRVRIEEETSATRTTLDNVGKKIEKALKHSAEDRFAKAEEALDAARELASGLPGAVELVIETETEVRRRIDAHRRHMAIDKVVQSVERQLEKAVIDEARRELAMAKRLYGVSDAFEELASKIDSRERAIQKLEVNRLIERALEERRPLDEVIEDLESAGTLDPDDERVQRLLVQTIAAQRRLEEDRVEHDAAEALARIDQLIVDGAPDKALSLLNEVVGTHGEFRTARLLRDRLTAQLNGG